MVDFKSKQAEDVPVVVIFANVLLEKTIICEVMKRQIQLRIVVMLEKTPVILLMEFDWVTY
jgi:hypothetical protein